MKFASLFSGGGGSCMGAIAAGLTHDWGLEYDPKIAEVYEENIGKVYCMDILEADPANFEPIDWLHASPVCKAFSTANANRGESEWDIACGNKVAEFVEVLRPKYFSLENVQAYQKAESFKLIVDKLYALGYWVEFGVLNAANFGVAQARKRLILRAVCGGFLPPLPPKERHVGWYEAIADLVHDLPDSQLAEWQVKALPKEIKEHYLVGYFSEKFNKKNKKQNKPAMTFLADECSENGRRAYKAILIENTGARSDRSLQTRNADEPSWTIRALGQDSHWHRASALVNARVVQLDIKCLARLQSFPDWYKFPDRKSIAGTIIGNSVPPLLMQKIIQATIFFIA